MKKFLTTILAFVYLSTSMGATVHLHYCMGKLISWGLADNESKNCNFCGMLKTNPVCEIANKNCCKDEHKHIQTEKDQKASEFSFQSLKYSPVIFVGCNNLETCYHHSIIAENPTTNSPPLSNKVPVFVLNCVYRI